MSTAKPIISLFKLQFSSVTMLKLLTSTCPQSRITPFCNHLRHGTKSNSPLLRFLGSLKNPCTSRSTYFYRRFFCSDSTDGSDPALESGSEAKRVESEGEDAESKSSSAIVPTVFRPEDCLTVSEDWSSSWFFLFFLFLKVLGFSLYILLIWISLQLLLCNGISNLIHNALLWFIVRVNIYIYIH